MTQTDQHTAWLKFHVFQAKIERKYTPVLQKEISTQIKSFNAKAKDIGFDRAASQIDNLFDVAGMMNIINDLHAESAGKWGEYIYKQFKNYKSIARPNFIKRNNAFQTKSVTLFGVAKSIADQIIAALRLSLLNNVYGIIDSIKNDILHYIQVGQQNGWAYDKTAKEIENKVGSRYRSQRIVRTESVKASNMGGIAGAKATGLLMDKVWLNARDERVRGNPAGKYPATQFDHWDLGGTQIAIDHAFYVNGDALQHPGDPTGNPADIINCRCTLAYRPKLDANGLPIRIAPRQYASQ